MLEDAELLRRYAATHAEADFAEVVRRQLNFVYSAALRQLNGDAHLARDVTQQVFTDLARKAAQVAEYRVPTGWLFTSTRFAAAKAVRSEQRRHAREREAQRMQEILHDESGAPLDWTQVRPVLDEVLSELEEPDRDAILLRFFEGRNYAAVGAKLGVTDNTARMRVERALDKLRGLLSRRGVTSTTAALGAALAEQAVMAAPAGLAAVVTGAALAGGGVGAGTAAGATTGFMSITKIQIGLAAGVTALGGVGYNVQAIETAEVRDRIAALQVSAAVASRSQAENRQLEQSVREAAALRADQLEFARLREEAERARTALQVATRAQASRAGAGRVAGANGTFEAGQLDQLPAPQFRTPPVYPVEMRQAGQTGEVTVEFIVDANGDVQNARAVKSSRPEFEAAAVAAIAQWKFRPGRKNQTVVNTRMEVPVVFTLNAGASSGTPQPKSGAGSAATQASWF